MDEFIPLDIEFEWLKEIVAINTSIAVFGSYIQSRFLPAIKWNDIDLLVPEEFHPQIFDIFKTHNMLIQSEYRVGGCNLRIKFFDGLEIDIIPASWELSKKFGYTGQVIYRHGGYHGSPLGFNTLKTKKIPLPQYKNTTVDRKQFLKQIQQGFTPHPDDVKYYR